MRVESHDELKLGKAKQYGGYGGAFTSRLVELWASENSLIITERTVS